MSPRRAPHSTRITPELPPESTRAVENCEEFPGEIVCSEEDPDTGDAPTDEVYRWSGAAYGLFYRAYSKGCYDEANSPICASVHYGREYVNAFWDGGHLSFGDEDGGLFNGFSVAVGVIAHEFIHGVVQYGLNLSYRQFVDPVEST